MVRLVVHPFCFHPVVYPSNKHIYDIDLNPCDAGIHVDGTIHMESTSDFHYQITLYFRRATDKRGSGSVFKVYTKLTADGCDMRFVSLSRRFKAH